MELEEVQKTAHDFDLVCAYCKVNRFDHHDEYCTMMMK